MFRSVQKFCDAKRIHLVSELKRHHFEKYLKGRKLGSNSVGVEIALLHKFGDYCKENNWCAENVVRSIKAPKYVPNIVEPYTLVEIQKMLQAAGSLDDETYERPRAVAMILSFRHTAIRISDLARLSRKMLVKVGDQWRMRLRAKKNHGLVFLPIPNILKIALDNLPIPKGADENCQYYFWNGVGDPASARYSIEPTLAKVFNKAGVEGAISHRFRHTLGTELLEQGATLEEVADILAVSLATVRIYYVKWTAGRQKRISSLMDKVQSAADRSIGKEDSSPS